MSYYIEPQQAKNILRDIREQFHTEEEFCEMVDQAIDTIPTECSVEECHELGELVYRIQQYSHVFY